ncbi:uncharacterized protein SPPG_07867 [Spizellomyces punctatus DAOM BR117]|uniref:Uncharacterized protein n=1 Tax=Spizellomyces punctatus (strain DAOM BR117) TaxID=645134 RepID=A0A0L0H6R3_SPIPD|nr:uncharacterized protein SPPG_07867 [Spizellomyces punctatus DAOM BR117]KNC96654.1 hypothetical protein SPPG_07867 [Spizellomyces punctatus DAOM BR117]|eukprot:XP_016604694.1 hypothetical protein SPPG_07867 [Spizellomyces punctatus DAOM BR117]
MHHLGVDLPVSSAIGTVIAATFIALTLFRRSRRASQQPKSADSVESKRLNDHGDPIAEEHLKGHNFDDQNEAQVAVAAEPDIIPAIGTAGNHEILMEPVDADVECLETDVSTTLELSADESQSNESPAKNVDMNPEALTSSENILDDTESPSLDSKAVVDSTAANDGSTKSHDPKSFSERLEIDRAALQATIDIQSLAKVANLDNLTKLEREREELRVNMATIKEDIDTERSSLLPKFEELEQERERLRARLGEGNSIVPTPVVDSEKLRELERQRMELQTSAAHNPPAIPVFDTANLSKLEELERKRGELLSKAATEEPVASEVGLANLSKIEELERRRAEMRVSSGGPVPVSPILERANLSKFEELERKRTEMRSGLVNTQFAATPGANLEKLEKLERRRSQFGTQVSENRPVSSIILDVSKIAELEKRRAENVVESPSPIETEVFQKLPLNRKASLTDLEQSRIEARQRAEADRLAALQKAEQEAFEKAQRSSIADEERQKAIKLAEEERARELAQAEQEAFEKAKAAAERVQALEQARKQAEEEKIKEEERLREEASKKRAEAMRKFEEEQKLKNMSAEEREIYLSTKF